MSVSFEGFPRVLNRSALRPGRWFAAADGLRPVLCFATAVVDPANPIALVFSAPRVEIIEVTAVAISAMPNPFATVEDEVVFAPGLTGDQSPVLVAPSRRPFRSGSLLRLLSGDLGIGFSPKAGVPMIIVSLTTGERAEGFDLVFERWSLALRRGDKESLLGHFKTGATFAEERRKG
jgi:hypothetical protein